MFTTCRETWHGEKLRRIWSKCVEVRYIVVCLTLVDVNDTPYLFMPFPWFIGHSMHNIVVVALQCCESSAHILHWHWLIIYTDSQYEYADSRYEYDTQLNSCTWLYLLAHISQSTRLGLSSCCVLLISKAGWCHLLPPLFVFREYGQYPVRWVYCGFTLGILRIHHLQVTISRNFFIILCISRTVPFLQIFQLGIL